MRKLKENWKVVLSLVLSFVLSFVIILTSSVPESYDYTVGDISTDDIYATREIEDKVTTQKRRDAAANQVEDKYTVNHQVTEDQLSKLQNMFSSVTEARNMELTLAGKISFIKEDIDITLSDDAVSFIATMETESYGTFTANIREVFYQVMDKGGMDVALSSDEMATLFEEKETDLMKRNIAGEIFNSYIKINEEYDEELTNLEKEKAKKLIEPTVYKKNQAIVRRGEVITDAQISLLSDMGVLKGSSRIN